MYRNVSPPSDRWHWVSVLLLTLFLWAFVCLHIPFMHADPDAQLSISRDAHTDEGLYSLQVRNYLNRGTWDLYESDGLVKTPLFSALIYLPLKTSGNALWACRTAVLAFCCLVIAFTSRRNWQRWVWILVICTGFTQYHLFQYLHFSLAEMPAICCIIGGWLMLARHLDSERQPESTLLLLYSTLLFTLAWWFKIQYIYLVPLVPAFMFGRWFITLFRKRQPAGELFQTAVIASLFSFLFLNIYILSWYLPHKNFWDTIMDHQTGGRWLEKGVYQLVIRENIEKNLLTYEVLPLLIAFAGALPAGILICFQPVPRTLKWLFALALFWVLVEMHKLPIRWVPSRYLVSLYAAMALTVAASYTGIAYLIRSRASQGLQWLAGGTTAIVLSAILLNHGWRLAQLYRERTFVLQDTSGYISERYTDLKRPAIGTWAPSLTWSTRIITVPVWDYFTQSMHPVEEYNPALIVAEPNEEDSQQAFYNRGVFPGSLAESTDSVQVARWPVKLYWLP